MSLGILNSKNLIEELMNSGSQFNGKSSSGEGVMLINSLDISKSFML